ncbi:hypothetical protein CAPN004_23750 [Capnocytophaga cynodegmi]|uniref:hypothetical protein n=1 Tax=Capnocytophaga cynodegmi TaxID=28189 RepID=UPI001ACC018F|nr:hypothetical protein [Capnocytophaga cynodegmi]GIM53346.1 hypothetical protein CAPN004_23750 [Capnocytophaga cynodegmi]
MNKKIFKYHKEEIIYILLILSEDLSLYDKDDLVCFTEAIEGRIDELFQRENIVYFLKEYEINDTIIKEMKTLKDKVMCLYSPQWREKLANQEEMEDIKILSTRVLEMLGIKKIKPLQYLENHLFL